MSDSARDAYLETQVMTATPQKLRLMLIEGALRFAKQTLHHWENKQDQEAFESIIRARSIVTELLASVQPEQGELTGPVIGVYTYLFQTLTEAQLERDQQKMADVIRVLDVERETWRLVCEQLTESPAPGGPESTTAGEVTASDLPAIAPIPPASDAHSGNTGGFAIDA